MFSSPAVQIYLSENTENHIQKKQMPHQLSRKPFIDRSVNGKSPDLKKLKSKITINKDNKVKPKISPKQVLSPFLAESDLNGEDFMYSGKEFEDTYNDVWPPLRFGKKGIIKILRDYTCPKNTPPPSPVADFDCLKPEPIDADFLELLPQEICHLQEPILIDESFEVALPELQTFEDLDASL